MRRGRFGSAAASLAAALLLLLRGARRDNPERPRLRIGVGHRRQLRLDSFCRHLPSSHRRGKGGAGGSFSFFVFDFVDEAGDQEVPRAVGEAKRRQRARDLMEGGKRESGFLC